MRDRIKLSFLMVIVIALSFGCQKDDSSGTEASEYTKKVNLFIKDVMDDVYLWYNKMPNINYKYELNSFDYFDKLLYTDDKWSFITDDVEALENSFEGIEKTYGYSLAFGRFIDTQDIFAIVEFVYPETPASAAGIKRGDIIVEMNGASITDNNYTDLLYSESISITLGILENEAIRADTSINLAAAQLNLNPVLFSNVVEHEGHKIGYMFYAQFIDNYNTSIDAALQNMINEQITDLVIDLRYNPGGVIWAAQHLCSAVAPLDVVNTNSILVKYFWNDKYQKEWVDNQIMHNLEVYFDKTAPVKLGLDHIHILTGSGTASASELTITGLSPYMDVTTVGDTTFGKYTGSTTFKPEEIYKSAGESYYGEISNWGIQPIILRYANSAGVTDFKGGFVPTIEAEDDLWNTLPLGTKEEPLFKAAIEDISGSPVIAMKSGRRQTTKIPYKLFDRGFSKFDRNKRELLIDNIDFNTLK
ncbi:S41 family peptidase [Prolixibacteraceae bacterium Z1-6]|uniref:S41 family peptidase n=1 Tax=Draconibacterium aestuarii TaxID=2998507 RepID=A0A9X3FAE9_9BACT|nr:S41 family peptidase [Prolixibacteraceae bacterium Z1-6]